MDNEKDQRNDDGNEDQRNDDGNEEGRDGGMDMNNGHEDQADNESPHHAISFDDFITSLREVQESMLELGNILLFLNIKLESVIDLYLNNQK